MEEEKKIWNIIDSYFKDNPKHLVKHQLESYNDFFDNNIKQILKEKNPITIIKDQDEKTKEFNLEAKMYFAGKNGNKLYYGKPIIYDENDNTHFMYPNEARLRNMTYGVTIHIDVVVEFRIKNSDGQIQEKSITFEKIYLGKFPIMVQSNLCILNGLSELIRFNYGECRNDYGGYFIIDGKEKVIVSQEKFADNMIYIRDSVNDYYSHSAEIRSVSEDASKPTRKMSISIVSPSSSLENQQIVVTIPNVRKAVPLFILMRALGVVSDKEIIQTCLLDLDNYRDYIELFRPSVYDAGAIYTQEEAIKYIATFTKGKTVAHVMEILMNFFLPHIGELNLKDKAYFLGYMVKKLLRVFTKEDKATDRDSYKYKRIETTGNLMSQLFKEYYNLQQIHIFKTIDKEYYYHKANYQKDFTSLFTHNMNEYFKEHILEQGFRKGFKGNWGAQEHTKRMGLVQDLNRLSYNSFISQLRKVNLPFDSNAKIVGPRLCHTTQWGFLDPVDTPDGGNVGLHNHLSITAHITNGCSGYDFINLLRSLKMKFLKECNFEYLSVHTKVLINGAWVGNIDSPKSIVETLKVYRRNGIIPIFTSISWNIQDNELYISTDGGRLCRPLFFLENNVPSYLRENVKDKITNKEYTWENLLLGFAKKEKTVVMKHCNIYKPKDLYNFDTTLSNLKNSGGVIEFIDTLEGETAFIAMNLEQITENVKKTHLEIHPSLIFGVMGNQIVYPENNQLPRNLFSCGQSKQGVSLYSSNYQNRIDKMGVILNYGQIPLIKSRYLQYINKEEHPYGENAIVAIMCYSGYNVEDAVLVNEGSLKRGFFRTTYFNNYEAYEESSTVAGNMIDSKFINIEKNDVIGTKPGYDYSYLDEYGLIKEETPLNDKIIVIGKGINNIENPDKLIDSSVAPKKGQLGVVDKSFLTEGEEGFRIAKIRIREERIPTYGDKVCSRCGQKGTIGNIIPEEDMPYTSNGIRPDIIINPHALPSRMTIGQLIECLVGKACVNYGSFGDCTAFVNKGPSYEKFGKMLTKVGFHSSGNEILYNGMTGEQLESEIFMGPTYYMRLKHMVKDKINHRARGPRTQLTRQTVHGRAKDGGLRIGEMERDGIIGHGMSAFLQESMMVRGDDFYMAVCNKTGTIAIYNESKNLFLSPMADGPIKFVGNLEDGLNIQNVSKFGRDFSIVRVPYAFKLLLQEIKTMNVVMRIITEDNVDQLTNLSYSDNYKVVSGFDSLKNVRESVKETLKKDGNNVTMEVNEESEQKTQPETSETVINKEDEEASPVYNPSSPMFEGGNNEEEEEEEEVKPITIKENEPVKLDVIEINTDDIKVNTDDIKVNENELLEDDLLDNSKEINETLTILTDLGDKPDNPDEAEVEEESSDSIKKIF